MAFFTTQLKDNVDNIALLVFKLSLLRSRSGRGHAMLTRGAGFIAWLRAERLRRKLIQTWRERKFERARVPQQCAQSEELVLMLALGRVKWQFPTIDPSTILSTMDGDQLAKNRQHG